MKIVITIFFYCNSNNKCILNFKLVAPQAYVFENEKDQFKQDWNGRRACNVELYNNITT